MTHVCAINKRTVYHGRMETSSVFSKLRDMGDKAPTIHIIAAGAGAALAQAAWDPPGASAYLTGVTLPYAPEETQAVLGFKPARFVSTETAIDLALAAYMKAWRAGRKAVGVGLTCSVASLREHRGDHRLEACVFTDDGCWTTSDVIPKGTGVKQRREDDRRACAMVAGLIDAALDGEDDPLVDCSDQAAACLYAHPLFNVDGTRTSADVVNPQDVVLFPGAFNPPHRGHFEGGHAAVCGLASARKEHRQVVYALVTDPPHKPALNVAQVLQRASMMRGHRLLVSQGDALYIDKARRHPGAYIAMGADAMDRMLDPTWGPAIGPMLDEFAALGTRFLVNPRLVDGEVLTPGRIISRRGYDALRRSELFIPVDFRCDVSSTQLREQGSLG